MALVLISGAVAPSTRPVLADVPFTITASTGGASARIDATVTRNGVTLPAAPLAVALPHDASWTVLDRTVPCLTGAELRQGHSASIPLTVKPFAPGRVALHADLGDAFTPGPAEIVFVQEDPAFESGLAQIVAVRAVRIGDTAPAVSTSEGAAVAHAGDREVALTGSRFGAVDALRIGDARYSKDTSSTSAVACFTGPAVAQPITPGATVSAPLLERNDVVRVFPLIVRNRRPLLSPPSILPNERIHVSTVPTKVTLSSESALMPAATQVEVRVAVLFPARKLVERYRKLHRC